MLRSVDLGAVFTPVGTNLKLNRLGYGALQLTGEMAWGPPRDRDEAIRVVREAVRLGVNHIDTSDFYGPHIANEIVREALHPYPSSLTIATKVGVVRGPDKSWRKALSAQELTSAVHDNLKHLGLDALEIVYLRVGDGRETSDGSITEPLSVLVKFKEQGLIRHIGLSNVTDRQLAESQSIADIVCVQNHYNVVHRRDDALLDDLGRRGIAFVPFFPLGGGFTPPRSPILDEAAKSLGATTRQVALAWLLQRSPNILVIAGTSSVDHLRENLKAADLKLTPGIVAQLNAIAAKEKSEWRAPAAKR
jgi:aryl-alcohol dehydrogenase-like predicted oxidoreductase